LIFLSISGKAPIVEKELSKAGAFDALQELLGDDLVGVDIYFVERGDHAGVLAE